MPQKKFISWNVNGIRACLKKGFADFVKNESPDFLCLQEVKLNPSAIPEEGFGFPNRYYHLAEKNGYSGTAIFSKEKPLAVHYDLEKDLLGHQREGRVITAEYDQFFLVNVYVPNSKSDLSRLDYRHKEWDPDFLGHLSALTKKKPVIACGDFNVAHKEIDLARPKDNHYSAGFTDEERAGMDAFVSNGFVDTFRHLNPDKENEYTWWSYRAGARERNVGWRIDYFLINQSPLIEKIDDASIFQSILGSDHCPVSLTLTL
jgi:exodeoxyribonuclease-3